MKKPPKELWVNVYPLATGDNLCAHRTAAKAAKEVDSTGFTAHYHLVVPKRPTRAYVVRRELRRTDEVTTYEYQEPNGGWTRDRYFADRYTPDRYEEAKFDATAVNEMDTDFPPARVVRIVKKI